MEEIAKQLTNKWKEIIESISVDGYSRKVESIDFIRMTKYYTGYPDIEWCYKVNFILEDGISYIKCRSMNHMISDSIKSKWHEKLQESFTNMFLDPDIDFNQKKDHPVLGSVSKFENSRVDYMTDQGYRFIIQFYPAGFLSTIRNEKLQELGI